MIDIKLNNKDCKINFDKMTVRFISSEEALKDVEPFELSDNVKNGKAKIIVTNKSNNS